MKNTIKTTFFAAGLALTVAATPASADFFNDSLDKIIKTVSDKGAPFLCRKGDAKKFIFSGRSFQGALCSRKEFAAIMEATCRNKDTYNDSGCAKKATTALNGADPQDIINGLGGKLKDLAMKVGAKK